MTEGFLFDGDVNAKWHNLELFWRTVRLYKIDGEKPRVELLRKITARKQAKYIRNANEFITKHNVIKATDTINLKGDSE